MSKRLTILEVAVAAEDLIGVKEWEKEEKYREIAEVLQRKYPAYHVKSLPFVMGQLGILTDKALTSLKLFRASTKLRARNKGTPGQNSSMELLVSKIQNVGLKGSLRIYAWFTGKGSNKVTSLEASSIPMEHVERQELPEGFRLKMLESFSDRKWHKTLTLKG